MGYVFFPTFLTHTQDTHSNEQSEILFWYPRLISPSKSDKTQKQKFLLINTWKCKIELEKQRRLWALSACYFCKIWVECCNFSFSKDFTCLLLRWSETIAAKFKKPLLVSTLKVISTAQWKETDKTSVRSTVESFGDFSNNLADLWPIVFV